MRLLIFGAKVLLLAVLGLFATSLWGTEQAVNAQDYVCGASCEFTETGPGGSWYCEPGGGTAGRACVAFQESCFIYYTAEECNLEGGG